jgi:hypothetical protein
MYCKVKNCRYGGTHTTGGHKCGKCHIYGHGQIECLNTTLKNNLSVYNNDTLPIELYCTVTDCKYKHTHTTISHHCRLCGKNHNVKDCPNQEDPVNINCPMCCKDLVMPKTPCKMFGLSDKCKVCMDNDIEVLLDCQHACLCLTCYKVLSKQIDVNGNILTSDDSGEEYYDSEDNDSEENNDSEEDEIHNNIIF